MALSSRVLPADQWHRLPPGVPKLVVYTAFFYFSTMFFGEHASAVIACSAALTALRGVMQLHSTCSIAFAPLHIFPATASELKCSDAAEWP